MEERAESKERLDGDDALYPARWERWLRGFVVALASIGVAYLFFTNLWWKPPPDFACSEDFSFAEESASGLCYWLNTEVYYANPPVPEALFTTDFAPVSGTEIGVPVGWAKQANAAFVENVVIPNIEWFGYVIWGAEAFIFLSLILGFLSRLGAFVAIGMSAHLLVALGGIPAPREWEWNYILMVLISVVLFAVPPGRYFGLDRLLRPRLLVLKERGSRFGSLLSALT